jgi:hypothetical protein
MAQANVLMFCRMYDVPDTSPAEALEQQAKPENFQKAILFWKSENAGHKSA